MPYQISMPSRARRYEPLLLTFALLSCGTGQTLEAAICGNGLREAGEACDDGNTEEDDGCAADCASGETLSISFNSCPLLVSLFTVPISVQHMRSAKLYAKAEDMDGEAVSYHWSAEEGVFSDASSASVEYTCTVPGEQTLTLWLTDASGCVTRAEALVICRPPE